MDQRRFDDLTRLVGAGGTRRRMLALLGGAITSAVLGPRGARACGGQACGPDLPDCCGGHECDVTGVCVPFQPQCAPEGNACISDDGCCRGKCCDGACHENFVCCPADFTSQSPDCAAGETCDNNGTCVPLPAQCGNGGDACGGDTDCCSDLVCSPANICVSAEVPPVDPGNTEQCKAIRARVAELNAIKAQLTADIAVETYKPRRVRLRRVRRSTQSKITILRRTYAQDCR